MITKEAIEAGCAAFESAFNGSPNSTEMVTTILTAAFAAMPGPAVKVKPLEWEDAPEFMGDDEVNYAEAVGAGYTYIAEAIDCTLDEAKAAAQAEYEARILSALTPAPDLASENERLRKMLAGCDWYWPEDDTSSEACADGPWQIVENCDVKPGEVFGYSRGGVVETRYYGFLEAAADAGSDDQFEADEPTREAAEAKISAELSRRAALERT